MTDDDSLARISAEVGSLKVEVEGEDMEEVSETFDEKWTDRLKEAEEMTEAMRTVRRGRYR